MEEEEEEEGGRGGRKEGRKEGRSEQKEKSENHSQRFGNKSTQITLYLGDPKFYKKTIFFIVFYSFCFCDFVFPFFPEPL